MKKVTCIAGVIFSSVFLSGCLFFSPNESDRLSYKIKSSLRNKFVNEEYSDNIRNKKGNLIRIKHRVNEKSEYANKTGYYDINARYENKNTNVNRIIFYRIKNIPISGGAENEIYLPVINNYKMEHVAIFPGYATGTFLTDYNRDGDLKRAVKGQLIKFKARSFDADILIGFDPDGLYVKPDDTIKAQQSSIG